MASSEMRSLFPVVVTSRLVEARDFYVRHFGFKVVFDAGWYVHLQASRGDGVPPIELAFMLPDVSTLPEPLRAPFSGAGLVLTIDVQDVDAVHQSLQDGGALKDVVVSLRDEPWGQRHVLFRDPVGNLVDIVKLIPPSAGYASAFVSK